MNKAADVNYRAEIDGLRGIAVLAILLFHFDLGFFTGGFIGVDVFFVLSGYLMTSMIEKAIIQKKFSYREFYQKRIRRILPALDLVLLVSLISGYFVLLRSEYIDLGREAFQSSLFKINHTLSHQGGYFDKASALKPLLPLWSIAVEMQFYFAWPLLLVLTPNRFKGPFLLFLTLFSFLLCFFLTTQSPDSAYYLMPARLWELSLGGIVAWIELKKHPRINSKAISWLALFIIISSSVLYSKNDQYPGWRALVPCLATALSLLNNDKELSRFFSGLWGKPFWYIGRISYSLYLWHWPLLYFLTVTSLMQVTLIAKVLTLLFCFILAAVSTRFFENPLRQTKKFSPLLILAFHLVIAGASWCALKWGNPQRASDSFLTDATYKKFTTDDCFLEAQTRKLADWCARDHRATPHHFLIGDSHAGALFSGVVHTSSAQESWAIAAKAGCAPHMNKCSDFFFRSADQLKNRQEIRDIVIYFSGRLIDESTAVLLKEEQGVNHSPRAMVIKEMIRFIDALSTPGRRITFLLATPAMTSFPLSCAARPVVLPHQPGPRCHLAKSELQELMKNYSHFVDELKTLRPGIRFINANDLFCEKNVCSVIDKNGIAHFSYGDHISASMAVKIARVIRSQ